MKLKGVLSGSKFNPRGHGTVIPDVIEPIKALKKLDSVKKIIIQQINRASPAPRRARIKEQRGNVHILVFRGVSAIQQITVIGSNSDDIESVVNNF